LHFNLHADACWHTYLYLFPFGLLTQLHFFLGDFFFLFLIIGMFIVFFRVLTVACCRHSLLELILGSHRRDTRLLYCVSSHGRAWPPQSLHGIAYFLFSFVFSSRFLHVRNPPTILRLDYFFCLLCFVRVHGCFAHGSLRLVTHMNESCHKCMVESCHACE